MKTLHVSDLGKIITGNTPPRSQPDLYGNYIPFIKATDITEGQKYTREPEEYYSERGYAKYKRSLIPAGATCVVTIGSIGKKMTMACCDCFINQAMNAVIPNKSFDAEYIYYALKFYLPKLKILDSGTASGRENVSKNAFSNMEIDIIEDYETQKTIGRILSTYDNLIENNQKQIKLLEEAAQRLYKEWFIDLRFPGHENTSVHDGLPEGWERKKVTDLLEIKYGKDHKALEDGTIPVYGSGGIMRRVEPILYSGESVLIPRKGSLNNILYVTGDFWTIDTMFYSIPKICNVAKYVYIFLSKIDMYSFNIGAAVPSMTVKILEGITVLLPPEKVLARFENVISPIFEKKRFLELQNEKAVQARDRLLPKLMSGELKL